MGKEEKNQPGGNPSTNRASGPALGSGVPTGTTGLSWMMGGRVGSCFAIVCTPQTGETKGARRNVQRARATGSLFRQGRAGDGVNPGPADAFNHAAQVLFRMARAVHPFGYLIEQNERCPEFDFHLAGVG